uniref:Uncharacterized protein n=1 Tax=Aegilops tauschii subsp. strangulata TaxID=200361 RepID=A0A453BGX4_AEGTS
STTASAAARRHGKSGFVNANNPVSWVETGMVSSRSGSGRLLLCSWLRPRSHCPSPPTPRPRP